MSPSFDYQRPALEAMLEEARRLEERIVTASEQTVVARLFREFDASRCRMYGARSRVWILHHCDFRVAAWEEEQSFWDEATALVEAIDAAFWRAARAQASLLEREFGPQIARVAFSECVIFPREDPLSVELAKRYSALSRLYAAPVLELEGITFGAVGVRRLFQRDRRDIRRRAWEAREAFVVRQEGELEAELGRCIELRDELARRAGFEGFVPFAFQRERRFGYDASDVAALRREVLDQVVPACSEILERRRAQLGFHRITIYDEEWIGGSASPRPRGDLDWFSTMLREVGREMHPLVGECVTTLQERGLMDLEARPFKAGGGWCNLIADVRLPFIVAQYDGSARAVSGILHELGHAFQKYAAREQPLIDYVRPTGEVSELTADAFSVLAWSWADRFFEPGVAELLLRQARWNALLVMVRATLIDHFEHELYQHPGLAPKQRNALFRDLERQYMPWHEYGPTMPALDSGAAWQLNALHAPLSTIEYALAQIGALELSERATYDRVQAIDDCVTMCRAGGSIPFLEVCKLGRLSSPFEPGTVRRVVGFVRAHLLGSSR